MKRLLGDTSPEDTTVAFGICHQEWFEPKLSVQRRAARRFWWAESPMPRFVAVRCTAMGGSAAAIRPRRWHTSVAGSPSYGTGRCPSQSVQWLWSAHPLEGICGRWRSERHGHSRGRILHGGEPG